MPPRINENPLRKSGQKHPPLTTYLVTVKFIYLFDLFMCTYITCLYIRANYIYGINLKP